MVLCYCHNEIGQGERTVSLQVQVDWGTEDEREQVNKGYVFCSFKCVSDWATDRGRDWDGVTVKSPAESHDPRQVVVDDESEMIVRGVPT